MNWRAGGIALLGGYGLSFMIMFDSGMKSGMKRVQGTGCRVELGWSSGTGRVRDGLGFMQGGAGRGVVRRGLPPRTWMNKK